MPSLNKMPKHRFEPELADFYQWFCNFFLTLLTPKSNQNKLKYQIPLLFTYVPHELMLLNYNVLVSLHKNNNVKGIQCIAENYVLLSL